MRIEHLTIQSYLLQGLITMSKRYTITPEQERRLANSMYSLIPNLEATPTDKAIVIDYEKGEYEIDIDKFIKITGLEWIQSINIMIIIELLLKYHLISQTSNKTIDTGYFELKRGENGHDLYALYEKTTLDFKEKLKTLYKQYISKEKSPRYTDIEALIQDSSKLFTQFRYSFFSQIGDNNELLPNPDYNYNNPGLLALMNALYKLSNLENLRGIDRSKIQEVSFGQLIIPTH